MKLEFSVQIFEKIPNLMKMRPGGVYGNEGGWVCSGCIWSERRVGFSCLSSRKSSGLLQAE